MLYGYLVSNRLDPLDRYIWKSLRCLLRGSFGEMPSLGSGKPEGAHAEPADMTVAHGRAARKS